VAGRTDAHSLVLCRLRGSNENAGLERRLIRDAARAPAHLGAGEHASAASVILLSRKIVRITEEVLPDRSLKSKIMESSAISATAGTGCRLLSNIILGLALVYTAVAAGIPASVPGLYYDEVAFVNAALPGDGDSFIRARIAGVPVMVMSYYGALKGWLYIPIFKIFGVSAETVRFPAIALSILALWITYYVARFSFDHFTSAILVFVAATDPAFVYQTKLDFGPIVLMNLLKMAALLSFFRMVKNMSVPSLWTLVIACLLGVFDKLNFIWFVLGLCLAAAGMFPAALRAMARKHGLRFWLPVSVLGIGLTSVSAVLIIPQWMRSQAEAVTITSRIRFLLELYTKTMNGNELYTWLTGSDLATPSPVNWMLTAAIPVLLIVSWVKLRSGHLSFADRVLGTYLILFAAIALQILFTQKANGPHHIVMLYPLQHILIFASVLILCSWLWPIGQTDKSRAVSRHWRQIVVAGTALVLVVPNILIGSSYQQAFLHPEHLKPRWSPLIYDVASYVEAADVDTIVFPDWGIHRQVFSLSNRATRAKCRDLWGEFKRADAGELLKIYQRDFAHKRVLAAVFAAEEVMPGAKGRLHDFTNRFSMVLQRKKVFTDALGAPVFEIYAIEGGG
jgi:hypothetical protein